MPHTPSYPALVPVPVPAPRGAPVQPVRFLAPGTWGISSRGRASHTRADAVSARAVGGDA
jgi:hypothetical protein